MANIAKTYRIKCDECKVTIGETDLLSESAAGGRCADCQAVLFIGCDIHYTGDRANHEADGTITAITDSKWGRNITIKMESGKIINVTPTAFSPGPGRRFYVKAEWMAQRQTKIAAMAAAMSTR